MIVIGVHIITYSFMCVALCVYVIIRKTMHTMYYLHTMSIVEYTMFQKWFWFGKAFQFHATEVEKR